MDDGKLTTFYTPPVIKPEKIYNPVDKTSYYVYNLSAGMDNYSQRKSAYKYQYRNLNIDGYTLCNVHIIGMGLIYIGVYDRFKSEIDKKYPELPRLPDKLAKYLIESNDMREYFAKRFPDQNKDFVNGVKDAIAPNEAHNSLSYGVNKFLDIGTVTYFSTRTSWKEIMYDLIYKGCPVGISGSFSGYDHLVLLVGAAYKSLNTKDGPSLDQIPKYIIVDDPLGKTYEYDKGLSGNDIWIPFEKCVKDFKPIDNPMFKFTHRFIKPQYLGI